MKSWDSFEEKDIANLLSGISYTVNKLKEKLNKDDLKKVYEWLYEVRSDK